MSHEMLQLVYSFNKKAEIVMKTLYGPQRPLALKQLWSKVECWDPYVTGPQASIIGVPHGDMMLFLSLLFFNDVLDMNDTELKRD